MSNSETPGSSQPLLIDSANSMRRTQEMQEDSSEIREDIGTPLDDEPELGDNSAVAGLNIGISQQESNFIDEETTSRENKSANQTAEQLAADTISSEEPIWLGQSNRPHSSCAATPTQDDNVSPEDISRIPVPNTGPQFLSFGTSDAVGSIPLPQIIEDGSDADIAIVDAISNVNVIPVNVDDASSDKDSDIRDISEHEVTEKDEFGRDKSKRRKGNDGFDNKVVTVEEVSDDDLPEVIEERTHRDRTGEDRDSDANSNFSMVSNNSLSAENCNFLDRDKKTKGDGINKNGPETGERDEISSLSGLSSEDEMRGNDRLQMMTGTDEIRDLEDGEIMRGVRRRGEPKNMSSVSNGNSLPSPSRNSAYGGSGAAGGRDSALSGKLSQSNFYGNKRRNKRTPNYDVAGGSEEGDLKMPHIMERQVIARDNSPTEQDEFDRRMGSSPNMYSFSRKDAGKRTDLPRYDVRNVIDRKKKVKDSKARRGRDNSRSPRSPYSKSPEHRTSPRSRSPSPRGRKRNNSKTRRKKRNKNKSNVKARSRTGSRSFSPRSFRSYSRSRSRSPTSLKRKKTKKIGRKNAPRSPSPRARRIVSPVKRRGRHSLSRSPSYDGKSRGFPVSGFRGRISRSPVRGAVDISPPPSKGRKDRRFSSPKKKKSGDLGSVGMKKITKASKKKQKNLDDNRMLSSPVELSNSAKKKKSGKNSSKSEHKGKNKGDKFVGSKKKRRDQLNFNDLSLINTHSSSVVEKEVYAAGDKIMVSVNFKSKPNKNVISPVKSGKDNCDANATKKPMVVIDCLASPYQVIEPSPKEIIDIYSDEDDAGGVFMTQGLDPSKQTPSKKQKKQKTQKSLQSNNNSSGGPAAVRVENVSSTVMPRTPSPIITDMRSPSPEDSLSNNVTSTQTSSINNILAAAQQNTLQITQQQSQINSNSDHANSGLNIPLGASDFSVDKVSGTIDKCINGVERELPSSSMSGQALIEKIQTLSHKGPCTPPPLTALESESFDLMRGPQTPNDEPLDSYDPCDPTESPDANEDFIINSKNIMAGGTVNSMINSGQTTMNGDNRNITTNNWINNSSEQATNSSTLDLMRGDINQNGDFLNARNGPVSINSNSNHLSQIHQERDSLLKTAATTIPFLMEDHDVGVSSTKDKDSHDRQDKDKLDFSVDMDMDSPFSPQSSEMSDIFEPPLDTPLTNRKMSNAMKRGNKNVSSSTGKPAIGASKHTKNKHNIHMKIVDDKLRIIDDVPSSAVELSVKEKFLKKVQRQERIVEEIKLVLKPYYNRKRINKDDYKDILRKCVPKVCHSKNGDINPLKIQKLVKGYVKKVSYTHKRQTI